MKISHEAVLMASCHPGRFVYSVCLHRSLACTLGAAIGPVEFRVGRRAIGQVAAGEAAQQQSLGIPPTFSTGRMFLGLYGTAVPAQLLR
jgi:hypothetical protein